MEYNLVQDGVMVSLHDETSEGWNGNYDPEDPDDNLLFRFDVSVMKDGDWDMVQSYCTQLHDLNHSKANVALNIIMLEVKDALLAGSSIKKTCERLSWISNDSLN